MQGNQLALVVDQANDRYVFGWGDVVAIVQSGPNDPVAAISANFSSHQISLGYMQDPFGRTFGNDRTQLGEHSN